MADCRQGQLRVQFTVEAEVVEENNAIAIIPSECFRWRARVQFIESFRTRAAALDFAGQNGYNLIVERNEGKNPLYDVLEDPEWACTTGLDLELLGTEEVLVDPGPNSWTLLLFSTVWDLSKRFAALMVLLYARAIVPLSRRAFAIARIYLRKSVPLLRRAAAITAVYLRKMIPLSRRVAAVTSLYVREEIAPRCRSAASRCWWSKGGLAFRRMWLRHTRGSVLDFARRSAAVGTLHARKISQAIGDAASRIQWADVLPSIRRACSTSFSTGYKLSRWFAATVVIFYQCEFAPRLRDAPSRYNWSDSKAIFVRACRISFSTGRRSSRRFAAAAGFYLREIVPLSRHTAAAVRMYLRDARQRARSAASSLSDNNCDQSRGNWVVAAQSHSNPSSMR